MLCSHRDDNSLFLHFSHQFDVFFAHGLCECISVYPDVVRVSVVRPCVGIVNLHVCQHRQRVEAR